MDGVFEWRQRMGLCYGRPDLYRVGQIPEWLEAGQKVRVRRGKYKGLEGVVATASQHELEKTGKVCVSVCL